MILKKKEYIIPIDDYSLEKSLKKEKKCQNQNRQKN